VFAATLTLAWDPSPQAAGYVIVYGTQPGVYTESRDVGNRTRETISGLAENTTYYFAVRAYNAAFSYGDLSREIPAMTAPAMGRSRSAPGSAGAITAGGADCSPGLHGRRTNKSLAVDPYDDRIVYAGIDGEGFFKTTDDGATWTRIVDGILKNSGGLCDAEFVATPIDPRNPEHVCIAMAGSGGTSELPQANRGVYCSDDGGRRWEPRTGAAMSTSVDALAIDPSDSQILYAGSTAIRATSPGNPSERLYNMVGAVYKSTDGGRSWTESPTGLTRGTRVTDIRIDPTRPATVYASTSGLRAGADDAYSETQFGVLKSIDGGATWKSMKTGLGAEPSQQAIVGMDLSPHDSRRLIVSVADGSHLLSADGADHFSRPAAPAIQAGISRFDPTDAKGMRIVGLSQAGAQVVESRDGGNTWRQIGTIPADMLNDGDILPAGRRVSHLEISHQDSRIMYLSGPGSVYRSRDGGASWSKILSRTRLPD
jgi:photosystem II stability/assembly factor-like uncharacterized protein